MNRVSDLRRQIFANDQSGAFERQPQKRCNSLPVLRRESRWIQNEKAYVPGEIPTRSISLTSKAGNPRRRSRIATVCRPISIFLIQDEGKSKQASVDEPDDYDSDQEDRLNGVRVTYSRNFGEELTKEVQRRVYDDLVRARSDRKTLRRELSTAEENYRIFEDLYLQCQDLGITWTHVEWDAFLGMEDRYLTLRRKLCFLEEKLQNLETHMASFGKFERPSADLNWSRQPGVDDESMVWGSSSHYDAWNKKAQDPPLVYKGRNYNEVM